MIKNSDIAPFQKLLIFSVLLLIVKIILIPFVHEIDADAISRTYLSLDFAQNPEIIKTGNWPPIFFYIMGGALMIYEDQFITPVVVNILFSIAILFPMFAALKRIFDNRISFLLCVIFSLSPIVFRMSMLSMSEIPYLFFAVLSINLVLKAVFENNKSVLSIAGLVMGIAGGIRYESWILGGLIIAFISYYKSIKTVFLFLLPFSIIPVGWIISNQLNVDDALNSFNWAIDLKSDRTINSLDSLLRRIWWYPLSLMFAFGPIAFFYFIKQARKFKTSTASRILFISLMIFFTIWLINALRGSLLLQHRFSITLFLIAFPFLGFYFQNKPERSNLKAAVFSLSAFFLAFGYSSKGARPIPRLLTNDAQEVALIIKKNLNPEDALICDFWNWETTYYLPFSTGLSRDKIKIIDKKRPTTSQVQTMIQRESNGVLLVNKNNDLMHSIKKEDDRYVYVSEKNQLKLDVFFENEIVFCFKYCRK